MIVRLGNGKTKFGPGVEITLTGEDVASAIESWLFAHDVTLSGPRTIRVNGDLCENANIYVDPSGHVIADRKKYSGRGDCCVKRIRFER